MSFDRLPIDMVVEILSKLSGEERARLATTNVAVARAVVRLNKKFEDKFSEEFPIEYARVLARNATVNDWQALYEDSNEQAYENFPDEARELLRVIKACPFDIERCKERIEAIASKMAGMEDKEDKLKYMEAFFYSFDQKELQTLVQWIWQHRQSSDIAKNVLNEIYTKIIERFFSEDKNRLLPFAILCHQPVDIIKRSMHSYDVDDKSVFGQTTLTLACQAGDTEVVDVLLEKGANINAEHGKGITPLMIASQFGNLGVVELLVNRGATLNADAMFKRACKFQHGEVALFFAPKCTDVDKAFKIACDCRQDKAVEALLPHIKDFEKAFLVSCLHGHYEVIEKLLGRVKLTKELLNHALLNASMTNGKTISLLINKGADVNAKTEDETTVLIQACLSAQYENIAVLLENHADINVASNGHLTPLGLACLTTSRNVSLLLKHGADVSFALKHALISGHINMIPVLIEHGAQVDMKMFSKVLDERKLDLAEKILQAGAMKDYRDLAKLLRVAQRRNDAKVIELLQPFVYKLKLQLINARAQECCESIRMINADVLDENHIKSLAEKYTALSDAKIRARHILPLISAINERVPHEQFMALIQHSRRSAVLSILFSDLTNKKFYDETVKPGLPRSSNENIVDQSSPASPKMR